MSSQVESDLYNRFSHLLQPIRDLTKNWDVDVATQLEEYIDEIAHITISFDGGITKMNFAEAALLIQGSTCVYSRKVEYLYALVHQTLDLVASKRKQDHALTDQDVDPDVSFAKRVEEDQFLPLDDIPVATNIDMDEQSDHAVAKSASTVPRTPISLIPLMDYEKTHSIPLFSKDGELIGSTMDFKMNTSIIHKSGALLLEPFDPIVLEASFGGGRAFTTNKKELKALLTPGYPGSPHFSKTLPLDNEPQDNFVGMDDSLDDMGGGFNSHLSPPQVVPELKPRRGGRVKITEEADPWTLLDPHDPGDKTQNKPFKKGITYRIPSSLVKKTSRKRKEISTTPSEPLAEFIRRSFYSCSSLFPKNPLKAPLSSEFEGHYWAEQKRRLQQKTRENLKLKRLRKDSALSLEERVGVEDLGDEDSLDGYQPLGDPVNDDCSRVELEAGFEGAFEGFHHSGGHMDIGNDPFQGVEPMALDESGTDCLGDNKVVQSYEDLVRKYVESTMTGVIAYSHETDLSKRVHKWEDRIKPQLLVEEQRPVFDIHQYGANVILEFKKTDSENKNNLYFRDIGTNRNVSEVCRLFAATLQLANDGKVLIESCDRQKVDSMKLTLLRTELAHKGP